MAPAVPELTTFGALLRFAFELEKAAQQLCERGAVESKEERPREVFRRLAIEHGRRHALLERVRREQLNELILEPIHDLRGEDYAIGAEGLNGVTPHDLIGAARAEERRAERFYLDCSRVAKSILAEVGRTFEKLGRQNGEHERKLQELLGHPAS